jgi:hypothetical protein
MKRINPITNSAQDKRDFKIRTFSDLNHYLDTFLGGEIARCAKATVFFMINRMLDQPATKPFKPFTMGDILRVTGEDIDVVVPSTSWLQNLDILVFDRSIGDNDPITLKYSTLFKDLYRNNDLGAGPKPVPTPPIIPRLLAAIDGTVDHEHNVREKEDRVFTKTIHRFLNTNRLFLQYSLTKCAGKEDSHISNDRKPMVVIEFIHSYVGIIGHTWFTGAGKVLAPETNVYYKVRPKKGSSLEEAEEELMLLMMEERI